MQTPLFLARHIKLLDNPRPYNIEVSYICCLNAEWDDSGFREKSFIVPYDSRYSYTSIHSGAILILKLSGNAEKPFKLYDSLVNYQKEIIETIENKETSFKTYR